MGEIDEILLPEAVRQQWIEACRRRLPHEACGVVFGRGEVGRLHVDGFAIIRNAAPDPANAFFFDPDDWVRAWYDAERGGRRIVGVFHSHPGGAARPSAADTAHRPGWGLYWIIGLDGHNANIEAYRPEPAGRWRRITQHRER